MTQPSNSGSTLSDVISAMGAEIDLACFELARIEDALSLSETSEALVRSDTLRTIQGIDLLHQRLTGLATLHRNLAQSLPQTWKIDAKPVLDGLLLRDMQSRIAQRLSDAPDAETAMCADNIELFEEEQPAWRSV